MEGVEASTKQMFALQDFAEQMVRDTHKKPKRNKAGKRSRRASIDTWTTDDEIIAELRSML